MAGRNHSGVAVRAAFVIGRTALDHRYAMASFGRVVGRAQADYTATNDHYAFRHRIESGFPSMAGSAFDLISGEVIR
jgi:hypothetical protein